MSSVISDFFGSAPAPAPAPVVTPAPAAPQIAPVDENAAAVARARIEQEKLRRGRQSLRTDSANAASSYTGGAGIAIPG